MDFLLGNTDTIFFKEGVNGWGDGELESSIVVAGWFRALGSVGDLALLGRRR